jgi:hypothetical protein
VSWSRPNATCSQTVAAGRWKGEYFNNPNLAGIPVMTLDDGVNLNLNFGQNSPNSNCGVFADNFSVQWARTVELGGALYRFNIAADDGVRLRIGGQLILDRWNDYVGATTVDVFLDGGTYEIIFELREGAIDAYASLSWSTPCIQNVLPERWRGEYFNNNQLAGIPRMIRDDGEILNFNWGDGSPSTDCGIPVDNFSVRFSRDVNFYRTGTWYFNVSSDDGFRLYVDGVKIFDRWTAGVGTNLVQTHLTAGVHQVKLEYLEVGGAASVSIFWSPFASCTAQCNPQFPGGSCLNADFCLYPGKGCRPGYALTPNNCCCPAQ